MATKVKGGLEALYGDIEIPEWLQGRERDSRVLQLQASLRGDMGGASTMTLQHPQSYQQRALRMWQGYNEDPLFKRMIDRCVDFAANGARWEVPKNNGSGDDEVELKPYSDKTTWTPDMKAAEREERFWNKWAEDVNDGVPNTVPGLDEITRWAAKHLLLSGAAVFHWELGTYRFGKQDFIAPTRFTCYPASALTLVRRQALFVEEQIFVKMPNPTLLGRGDSPFAMQEGVSIEAQPAVTAGRVLRPGYQELAQIGEATGVGDTEAFVLKYGWSPGDITTLRTGQLTHNGQSVYPTPPFMSLLPILAMRQKFFAADLAILDGIINYLMMWKIGDKDNPPKPPEKNAAGAVVKPGTIALVKQLVQEGLTGQGVEMFLPYYVNLDIKMPDTGVLTNTEKYTQSTLEILQSFGIFFSPPSVREKMENINISQFEEFMVGLRGAIAGFKRLIARRIMELNRKKLRNRPIWTPNPLNTKSDDFLASLVALAKLGRVSWQTLLRSHGIDDNVEERRIAELIGRRLDVLLNKNVPLSYKQDVVAPGAGTPNRTPDTTAPKEDSPSEDMPEKETTVSPTRQPGRPPQTGRASKRRKK